MISIQLHGFKYSYPILIIKCFQVIIVYNNSHLFCRKLCAFKLLIITVSKQLLVRQWSGRPGFNPRSRHTKDFKNCT